MEEAEKKNQKEVISINIESSVLATLDQLAEQLKRNRSNTLNLVLEKALPRFLSNPAELI